MDTPITKRLIISGLTASITADDISRRLSTFGTVKASDGFGLTDGVGQPRKFAYVTLETTTGKLAKCMNLLSGSTWKGAKLRFGEAKPDFRERIALENKAAAEEPPRKRRKKNAGSQAEDMTLVTPVNVVDREGWEVSPLGRITWPVKMRPEMPLPENQHEKPEATLKNDVRVGTEELQNEEQKSQQTKEKEDLPARVTSIKSTERKAQTSTKLKDLFAPREEEAGFSLLGHLDLELELDDEAPFFSEQPASTEDQTHTPLPLTTYSSHSSQAPIVINPKQALFFPHRQQQQGALNKVRQKDVFDLIKDNHWNWRDPSVGFYRTGTEEDIRKRWEEGKSILTKEWKKRWREAGKANRRRRGDGDVDIEY